VFWWKNHCKIVANSFQPKPENVTGLPSLAIIASVLIVVAIFIPIFPYSQSSSWFYGMGNTTVKADVSLAFLLFHCGAYMNANSTSTLLGVGLTSPASKGYTSIVTLESSVRNS
jgi:hypothetical protein